MKQIITGFRGVWSVTSVVEKLGITGFQRLLGRLEIAYRILRITMLARNEQRNQRSIEKHRINLSFYGVTMVAATPEEKEEETEDRVEEDHIYCPIPTQPVMDLEVGLIAFVNNTELHRN